MPRLDNVLRNEDHCYFASNIDELISKCETLLRSDPQPLYYKSAQAAKYIEERHTQYHRMKFKIPVIAVTGSTGKTIVKEIISHVLSEKYNVLKNEGTKNNLIGLPLTLLKLNEKHNLSVLEMGASRLGEIKRLSDIAKPTVGVITNIGPTHLEFLDDVSNVFRAKSELLDSLDSNSLVLLNRDDRFLAGAKTRCKRIYFGIDSDCEFRATHIEKKDNKIYNT